jgi:hypothetical protein
MIRRIWEWITRYLKLNLKLITSHLEMNYKLTINGLQVNFKWVMNKLWTYKWKYMWMNSIHHVSPPILISMIKNMIKKGRIKKKKTWTWSTRTTNHYENEKHEHDQEHHHSQHNMNTNICNASQALMSWTWSRLTRTWSIR